MNVIDAITSIDSLKPNNYSQSEKIKWLSKIEGMIKTEIVDTHEDGDDIIFDGFTEDSLEQELIAKAPYDDVYIKWLEAQIDYANGEYGRYNNTSTSFNIAYANFSNYYNRKHMPKGNNIKYF